MSHTVLRYTVVHDNTGVHVEMPVILTEYGPLMPLVDYLLIRHHVTSERSVAKLVQAVGLLIDFMEANHDCFENPKDLFEAFVQRLYTGTIGVDGSDPSDLYWDGRKPQAVRALVSQLSTFSDWMAEELGTTSLNPWRQATRAEEQLAWAAWHHRKSRAFLNHSMDRETARIKISQARNALLKRSPVIDHEPVKYFPDGRFADLIFRGFIVPGKQKSPRIEERLNLRDVLITLLLHFGGLRMSEPFHLYVHDVMPDSLHLGSAWVRVFHPSEGTAPDDLRDAKGKPVECRRADYLRSRWGMLPRTEYPATHTLHAGWKNNALDGKAHHANVNWFPTWAGELFWKLWVFYMAERSRLACDHPFAFVTLEGKPYSIDAYKRAHRTAIRRIGLTPAKSLGTTPHGHRHAYGQRLTDADIDPLVRKKALHHKSLESQAVYTEPDRRKLAQLLEAATRRAQAGEHGPKLTPPDVLAYGFRDVDPLGLLSGPHPKLRRSR